jgi:hypothetical protein
MGVFLTGVAIILGVFGDIGVSCLGCGSGVDCLEVFLPGENNALFRRSLADVGVAILKGVLDFGVLDFSGVFILMGVLVLMTTGVSAEPRLLNVFKGVAVAEEIEG